MVEVTNKTANWRLFGGGGLLLAGILWVIAIVLTVSGVATVPAWITVVALLVIAVAHLFLTFGESGSNGIVGALRWGKGALLVAAAGWLLWSISGLLAILGTHVGSVVDWIVAVAIVVGGLVSAVAIYGRGVAKGLAQWALFLPVLWSVFLMLVILIPVYLDSSGWVSLGLAILLGLTGLAYLCNKVDIPSAKD